MKRTGIDQRGGIVGRGLHAPNEVTFRTVKTLLAVDDDLANLHLVQLAVEEGAGCDGHMSKPLDMAAFVATLRTSLA